MTDPARGPGHGSPGHGSPGHGSPEGKHPPKPRHDPAQDLLILVIVVMCSIIAVKLVMEFAAWNKLQTCISSGRNCAPRTSGP